MSELYRLLQKLGLFFDPDRDGIRNPWTGQPETRRTATRTEPEPDNIVYDKKGGRARTFEMDTDNCVLIWDDYNPDSADRTAEFTEADRDIIQEWRQDSLRPNLSERNYRILKAIFAEGLSAKRAAEDSRNRNGPGYSTRTLDNYWAAMSAASARRKHGKTPTPAQK